MIVKKTDLLILRIGRYFENFKFYLSLCFIAAVFLIVLDFIYRIEYLIRNISFTGLSVNFALIFYIAGSFCLFVSLVFALIELSFSGYQAKKNIAGFQTFLVCAVFVYFNLLYFKFYMFAFTNFDKTLIARICFVLFPVISIPVFLFREKLLEYKAPRKLDFLFIFFWVIYIPSFILFLISTTPAEGLPGETAGDDFSGGKPHILFITADSSGVCDISRYGNSCGTSGDREQLAKRFCIFENLISDSNYILYSLPASVRPIPSQSGGNIDEILNAVFGENRYGRRIFIGSAQGLGRGYKGNFSEIINTAQIRNPDRLNKIQHKMILNLVLKNRFNKDMVWFPRLMSEDMRFFNLLSSYDPRDPEPCGDRFYPGVPSLYSDYIQNILKNSRTPVFIWYHIMPYHSALGHSVGPLPNSDYSIGNIVETINKENLSNKTLIVIVGFQWDSLEEHRENNDGVETKDMEN